MAWKDFVKDLEDLNLSDAAKRAEDWMATLPPAVQRGLQLAETESGQALTALCKDAVADIMAAGITTGNFTAKAAEIFSQLLGQGYDVLLQDVYAFLNAEFGTSFSVDSSAAAGEQAVS